MGVARTVCVRTSSVHYLNQSDQGGCSPGLMKTEFPGFLSVLPKGGRVNLSPRALGKGPALPCWLCDLGWASDETSLSTRMTSGDCWKRSKEKIYGSLMDSGNCCEVPGTHLVEGENEFHQVVLWSPHRDCSVHVCVHVYMGNKLFLT